MDSMVQIALKELEAEKCVCGAEKQKRQSFCRKCYLALPQKLRSELYKPMSDGYAEVHEEAKDWLRINTDRLNKKAGSLF